MWRSALACVVVVASWSTARADLTRQAIEPKNVNDKVTAGLDAHVVVYDPADKDPGLLVFLTGTRGTPEHAAKALTEVAVAHHYRVIVLSYIDDPAIAEICPKRHEASCAENVRTRRAFGDDKATDLIADTHADGIVPRLHDLLVYLDKQNPKAGWRAYLDGDAPKWSRIAVAGQSQGGGMAEMIAKRYAVARVLSFSGGWDTAGKRGVLASWYGNKAATPADRWFGTYHVEEPFHELLAKKYAALGLSSDHTFALDKPVPNGRKAHGQGLMNEDYKPVWEKMLGDGSRQ